jgi:hypothetical protein
VAATSPSVATSNRNLSTPQLQIVHRPGTCLPRSVGAVAGRLPGRLPNFINLISSIVYVFVLPFVAIASTYMYFDLRVAMKYEELSAETADVLPVEPTSSARTLAPQ